jgi:prolipoprotein diacylglyceryl transferase
MVSQAHGTPLAFLPSPSINGFHIGPLFVHFYGLMYVVGIALAIYITRRRWRAAGGDPGLVGDVATWAVPFGIIGGRIYFDLTTPSDIPHHWWGVFAVWSGGLGIWGGIALGAAAGIWRVRRAGQSAGLFGNAVAPALLVAQAIGRIGNYFNQELFGKPSGLPWALEISAAHRPAGYTQFATFQPTFLYESLWDALVGALVIYAARRFLLAGDRTFALYLGLYALGRFLTQALAVDYSPSVFGLRVDQVLMILIVAGAIAYLCMTRNEQGPDTVTDTRSASSAGAALG